jgi:D-alanyl-D-alanine carboxypeptidase
MLDSHDIEWYHGRSTNIIDPAELEALAPGILFGLWSGSCPIQVQASGISDIMSPTPTIALDMHMRIGSITKTMTSTVILKLVDEGKLSLDD